MSDRPQLPRRDFLKTSVTTAGVLAASPLFAQNESAAPMTDATPDEKPRRVKLAVKYGMVGTKGSMAEKFALLKEIGYDGVELNSPNNFDTDEVLRAIDETGLPVHGVVDSVHWRQTLSHPDPDVRAQGLAGLRTALRDAKTYGATSVLLVPAVVNKQVSYKDAYTRSQEQIRLALPTAEELGIDILFENVWNNFLLSPVEAARYIDEFESDRVGMYFDVGNIVRYGWPEHWLLALGPRVKKLDIKEYSRKLQNSEGPGAGFRVELGEGDCDWPAVGKALKEIEYTGWGTAEVRGGDAERLRDIFRRMSDILD